MNIQSITLLGCPDETEDSLFIAHALHTYIKALHHACLDLYSALLNLPLCTSLIPTHALTHSHPHSLTHLPLLCLVGNHGDDLLVCSGLFPDSLLQILHLTHQQFVLTLHCLTPSIRLGEGLLCVCVGVCVCACVCVCTHVSRCVCVCVRVCVCVTV